MLDWTNAPGGGIPYDISRGLNPSGGKTFYVSNLSAASNSDSNEGTDPQYPLATIAAAITLSAVSGQRKGDYIFVQDSYDQDTWPVVINVRNVHLIGLGGGGYSGTRAGADGVGESCFKTNTAGGGFELAGFNMGCSTQEDPCILQDGVVWSAYVHHNAFGVTIVGQDGISATGASQMAYWTISHNYFGMQLRNGIYVEADSRSHIMHNVFRSNSGVCISISTGILGVIAGNMFSAPITQAEDEGWAISVLVNGTGGMIMGNMASQAGNGAIGNNPYYDGSAATAALAKNCWANNFDGAALSGGPAVND